MYQIFIFLRSHLHYFMHFLSLLWRTFLRNTLYHVLIGSSLTMANLYRTASSSKRGIENETAPTEFPLFAATVPQWFRKAKNQDARTGATGFSIRLFARTALTRSFALHCSLRSRTSLCPFVLSRGHGKECEEHWPSTPICS